jgi:hypothetical protein
MVVTEEQRAGPPCQDRSVSERVPCQSEREYLPAAQVSNDCATVVSINSSVGNC